jgi:inner membrane protein
VGVIVGETVAAHVRSRRNALLTVAVIGSNAPDLDLLVSYGGSGPGNLDYLLWHRGYTHTLIGCVLLALCLYGAVEVWMRLRHLEPSASERLLLAGTALVTTGLHLGMDYLNSYGVHPFWPADNRWLYGDSVFIVEPLYWVAAAPLFFLWRSVLARFLLIAALLGAMVLGIVAGFLTWGGCAILIAATAALIAFSRRASAHSATRTSVALAVGVTLAFVSASGAATRQVQSTADQAFAHARTLDRVLTPVPANPLCWDLWLLQLENDRYIARHASVSIAPSLEAAASCPSARPIEHTAPWSRVGASSSAEVNWLGEFSMTRTELDREVAADCRAQAFMQFARAPFLAAATGIARTGTSDPDRVLGDLRFDRDREGRSFELAVGTASQSSHAQRSPCPRAAPWTAPRADLLDTVP